jgi:hypothetical protein
MGGSKSRPYEGIFTVKSRHPVEKRGPGFLQLFKNTGFRLEFIRLRRAGMTKREDLRPPDSIFIRCITRFVQATGSGFEQIAITAGPVRHKNKKE